MNSPGSVTGENKTWNCTAMDDCEQDNDGYSANNRRSLVVQINYRRKNCKPGSVFSRRQKTAGKRQSFDWPFPRYPAKKALSDLPQGIKTDRFPFTASRERLPAAWSCTGQGLHAVCRYRKRGGLLPRHFTTHPFYQRQKERSLFCCTSVSLRTPSSSKGVLSCGARTFLWSGLLWCATATARSSACSYCH